MAKKQRKPAQIGLRKEYACPHCVAVYRSVTPGDQQLINLHLVMHVKDRDQRMKLLSELMEGAAQQALFL